MFRVKAKTKPGQCCAMRCKLPVTHQGTGVGIGLCDRHFGEWQEAGTPEMAAVSAPPKSAGSALLAPDAVRAEIEPTRSNLETLLQKVSTLPLDNQPALDWMGAARKFAREAREWLDTRRKSIKAPILEAGKVCDAVFKPGMEQADAVIDCVDERLLALVGGAKAAQDAALAAVGQGAADEHTLVAAHGGGVQLPETVAMRSILRVRVVGADGQPCEVKDSPVHKAFLQLDESLALEYARGRGGAACKVPGLEFYLEETIVAARVS